MAIKSRAPVRNEFSGCSTCNGNYYDTKSAGVNAYDDALRRNGFEFCAESWFDADFNGDEGRVNLDVLNDSGGYEGCALLSWYRMPSGRYEFTGYLA